MLDVAEGRTTTHFRPSNDELAINAAHLLPWVILLRNNKNLPTGKNKDE
jgi:hypothetical protein